MYVMEDKGSYQQLEDLLQKLLSSEYHSCHGRDVDGSTLTIPFDAGMLTTPQNPIDVNIMKT
jgi:hypothetical protein